MITLAQLRRWRLQQNGLIEPFADLESATQALGGVQAQILSAAALALAQRVPGLTWANFEQAYYHERRLLKIWHHRGTLHLISRQAWPEAVALRANHPSWWRRQAPKRYGMSPETYDQWVDKAAALAAQHGQIGRSHLRAAGFPDNLLSSWGGIFTDLVYQGLACNVGAQAGEGVFAHRSHWLPDLVWRPPTQAEARARLVAQYFATYGPAPWSDLAYWAGASVSQVKQWAPELALTEVQWPGGQGLMPTAQAAALAATPEHLDDQPLKLLYRFEPLLLAHKDKTWLVPAEHYSKVWRPAGHIEGIVLAHGEVLGTWRYHKQARQLHIDVQPWRTFHKAEQQALHQQAEGIAHFWGASVWRLSGV
jgi:hypothetical protein